VTETLKTSIVFVEEIPLINMYVNKNEAGYDKNRNAFFQNLP